MKKVLLLGAMAAVAMSASAQFTCDPVLSKVLEKNPTKIWGITLSDVSVAKIEEAKIAYEYIGPDAEAGRNLWYWDQTFVANETPIVRVGEEDGDPINVSVAENTTWSGAGLAVAAPGVNLSEFNDNTRFHIAYSTCGTAPASIALILLNKDDGKPASIPAKISLGADFNDNGDVFPSVGPACNDEWQGIDLSLGDLKKLWPDFDLQNKAAWEGNLISFLGGGVAGQTFALDAIYFYTCEPLNNDAVDVVVDDNAAAEYYTVDGVKVANPEEGQLYIVVKGGKASKVVL